MKRPICLSLLLLSMALVPSARADHFSWGLGLGYGGIGFSGYYGGSHVSIPFSLTFPYSYYAPVYTPPVYGSNYYSSPYEYSYPYRYDYSYRPYNYYRPYSYDYYPYSYPYSRYYYPYRGWDRDRDHGDRHDHDRDNWRGHDRDYRRDNDRDHRRDGGDNYRRDDGRRDSNRGRDAMRYGDRGSTGYRGGYQADSRSGGYSYRGDFSRSGSRDSGRTFNAGSAYRTDSGRGGSMSRGSYGGSARGGSGRSGR